MKCQSTTVQRRRLWRGSQAYQLRALRREKVEGSTKSIPQLLVRRPLALRSGPRGTEQRPPGWPEFGILHNIPIVKTKSYTLSSYWGKLHTRIGKSTLSRWLLRMTGRSDCIDTFSGSTKPLSPIRQADPSKLFGCASRVKQSGGGLEIAFSGSIGSAASMRWICALHRGILRRRLVIQHSNSREALQEIILSAIELNHVCFFEIHLSWTLISSHSQLSSKPYLRLRSSLA
jgi:hypothetical protein